MTPIIEAKDLTLEQDLQLVCFEKDGVRGIGIRMTSSIIVIYESNDPGISWVDLLSRFASSLRKS